MPEKLFFLTTRGLEAISAGEIATFPEVKIDHIGYRCITASCKKPLAPLCNLRTVDDIFLHLATWHNIGRHRQTLSLLKALSSQLDLASAAATCVELRKIPERPAFSVTASFVGKRNYSAVEIKNVLSDRIVSRYNWRYTDDDGAADLNVRLFIEGAKALAGLRLNRRPMHDRQYKKAHVPGSLKPPVAAAMLRLIGISPGQRLLDPCCGAGTILAEAGKYGAALIGGDNDPAAISAADINMKAARAAAMINRWDAVALPIPSGSIDCIVSNLPWDRQVAISNSLSRFYRRVCKEMQRVLAPSGRIALITTAPHWIEFQDLQCDNRIEISLYGQMPTILTFRGWEERHSSLKRASH
jgi:tRNA (guanine6-N2)-methyltransferase